MEPETTPKYTEQEVPNFQDSQNAVLKQYTDLRGMRYMEFFLVGSVPVNGQIKGTCYNTTNFNLTLGGRDSCPQELVEKLDPDELAKQYGVSYVMLNSPRQWLLDGIDLPMAVQVEVLTRVPVSVQQPDRGEVPSTMPILPMAGLRVGVILAALPMVFPAELLLETGPMAGLALPTVLPTGLLLETGRESGIYL